MFFFLIPFFLFLLQFILVFFVSSLFGLVFMFPVKLALCLCFYSFFCFFFFFFVTGRGKGSGRRHQVHRRRRHESYRGWRNGETKKYWSVVVKGPTDQTVQLTNQPNKTTNRANQPTNQTNQLINQATNQTNYQIDQLLVGSQPNKSTNPPSQSTKLTTRMPKGNFNTLRACIYIAQVGDLSMPFIGYTVRQWSRPLSSIKSIHQSTNQQPYHHNLFKTDDRHLQALQHKVRDDGHEGPEQSTNQSTNQQHLYCNFTKTDQRLIHILHRETRDDGRQQSTINQQTNNTIIEN